MEEVASDRRQKIKKFGKGEHTRALDIKGVSCVSMRTEYLNKDPKSRNFHQLSGRVVSI